MERPQPTLHPDYQIGDRVEVEPSPGQILTGRIVGVAFAHVIFSYIVLLDEPIDVPGWDQPWEAVSVVGGSIRRVLPKVA